MEVRFRLTGCCEKVTLWCPLLYLHTMPYSINIVRFTDRFVVFHQIALRLDAIETVEQLYDHATQLWFLKIRMDSGTRYTFTSNDSVQNWFDRLTS